MLKPCYAMLCCAFCASRHRAVRSAQPLALSAGGTRGCSLTPWAVQEVVLATHQDAFFAETQYANFGEMAEHINAALSEFRVSDIAALIESALAMPRGLGCAIDVMAFAHAVRATVGGRWPVGHTRQCGAPLQRSAVCLPHVVARRVLRYVWQAKSSSNDKISAGMPSVADMQAHTQTRSAAAAAHARVRSARTAGSSALHRSLPPMAVSPTSR